MQSNPMTREKGDIPYSFACRGWIRRLRFSFALGKKIETLPSTCYDGGEDD